MSTTLQGAPWRKSTRSQGANACVEVAVTDAAVGVRDTKNRAAGRLTMTPQQWGTFTTAIKTGRFDHQ